MKKYFSLLLFFIIALCLFSCKGENLDDVVSTDLSSMIIEEKNYAQNQVLQSPQYELLDDTLTYKSYKYNVGVLVNVPISYGSGMGFDGIPVDLECSTEIVNQETISNALEECTSILRSAETEVNFGMSIDIPDSIPLNFEYSGYSKTCESLETTSKKSYENSSTYIKSFGEKISYPLNSEYCKVGYKYRLVLTSAYNVYIISIYDKILDTINNYYYMEEIPNEITIYIEECEKGTLWSDNNFTNLEYPTIDPEKDGIKNSEVSGNLEISYARNNEVKITDDGRDNQHQDRINFADIFGYTSENLINAGYDKIKISFSLELKEENDGYQHIILYAGGYEINSITIEHGGSKKNESYGRYEYNFEYDLNLFSESNLTFKYVGSGNFDDNWYNKNLSVKITFVNSDSNLAK